VLLASVSSSFTSQVASHGVYAVFILMMIDAVFPAASELVMLYAGAVAAGVFADAQITLFGKTIPFGFGAYVVMALAGTLGYLVGSLIGWGIGRWGGRPLLERHGRWFRLKADDLDRAEAWFAKWGRFGVPVGRITPIVRSFVSIPAGVLEMPLGVYTVLTLIGSAIWAFAIAGAGYALGSSYKHFDHGFKYAEYLVVAGVLVLAAYLAWRWLRPARVNRRADDPPH
jgi:membrane protein DedA with SNARE-associated domain